MRNSGHQFETDLLADCAQYQKAGVMRLKKVDNPIKTFGKRVIHLKNPFLDFVGSWTERSGRMICIEAKASKGPKLPLGSKLTTAQQDNLRLWERAGAVSFLIWNYGSECRIWTVAMIEEEAKHRKHLKFENGIKVPVGDGFLRWDFRKVMLRVWNT